MSPDTTNTAVTIISSSFLFSCVIGLVAIVLGVLIFWQIFSKAGYSGAWALLMLIPVANIVALCILAFGRWPVREELEQLRAYVGQWHGGATPPGAAPGSFSRPGFPPQG
ncbi:MAG: hypothetical protein IRZ31_18755 [Thermogemmatispora sp.]|uniref:hypothetical protein n=1 Tax=Thermogemmatispora sp. TaxID=1968838 RepID=UPI002626A59E|nr:hypothetical protein [Thermogemmatispora sp.]MBX5458939.1 hypothetical protein [Thermogemmatispora sp.]